MNKNGRILITIVAVAAVFLLGVLYTVMSYNKFVYLSQDIDGKWSEVENQYQRQADLIPNIVSTVSSAVKVETKFVEDVTSARTAWLNAKTQIEKDTAGVDMNNKINTMLNFVATAENYPQLQANKQYTALVDELSGTQNRITTARGRYIESIQNYNIAVKKFPSNIIASLFGYSGKDYYHAEVGSLGTPKLGNGTLL